MVDAEDTLVTPVKPPGSPKGEKPGRPVMEKETERQLRRLVRLSDNEVELLALEDFTTLNDLVLLDIDEQDDILPSVTRKKWKALVMIGEYIFNKHAITDETTMIDIKTALSDVTTVSPKMAGAPAGPPDIAGMLAGSSTPTTPPRARPTQRTTQAVTPDEVLKGAPKFYVDGLEDFDGRAEKWNGWERKTEATLRQTAYADFLDRPPGLGNAVEQRRNMEMYNMILTAVQGGDAHHVVHKPELMNDGYSAWQALREWYGSDLVSRHRVTYYRNQLERNKLSTDNTATSYINIFAISMRELDELNEAPTETSRREHFLRGITDPDYDVLVQQLSGDRSVPLSDCIMRVREREQVLLSQAADQSAKMARRGRADQDSNDTTKSTAKGTIPYIPNHILNRIEPASLRSDLLKWRSVYNREGRIVSSKDLEGGSSETGSSTKSNEASKNSEKDRRSNRNKKRKARRTMTGLSGTPDPSGSFRVNIKDEDDDDGPVVDDDDNKESTSENRPDSTDTTKKGRRGYKSARRTGSDSTGHGGSGAAARGVIDPGTDYEVIGGIGWEVETVTNVTTAMGGYFTGDDDRCRLPVVSAITAYEHPEIGTVLLGIGAAAWDDRAEQTESLLNSHELRYHGVVVDDKAERDGGGQKLTVNGIDVRLDFENGRLLYIPIRRPTQDELANLTVHWLIPKTPAAASGLLQRRTQAKFVPEDTPWSDRLGGCPEETVKHTLAATTQLCAGPVEMDNRDSPRQHRKSRLLPLHPVRIEGRTDSDTYFSATKSVRGYMCVQLFICHVSHFLFVRCLRREAHSHAAYQDFIRYVGAPNVLLTDNSQTQTGKLWQTTSRQHAVRQINSAPHSQNQNRAERSIQDVKRRTITVLRKTQAPLTFWCYALHFVVDCLNHTAHERLSWRTPIERLKGHTPDISLFRFAFWEPVWYHEPTAKYPEPNLLPGRFVGIAWHHGDAFTYKIWTTPKARWEDGRELIRSIVRSRDESDSTPKTDDITDLTFSARIPGTGKRPVLRKLGTGEPTREGSVVTVSTDPPEVVPAAAPGTHLADRGEPKATPTTTETTAGSSGQERRRPRVAAESDNDEEEDTATGAGGFDPSNPDDKVETVNEVNDELDARRGETIEGNNPPTAITAHSWSHGKLMLTVLWPTQQTTVERFRDMKTDHPMMTARYILAKNVSRKKRSDRNIAWAKKVVRDCERAVRRITRLYDTFLDEHDEVRVSRRVTNRPKKKKKRIDYSKPVFKYGVQVPRTVLQALELDKANKDEAWKEAIKKEITTLNDVECFQFEKADYSPGPTYQKTTLHMIFDVKHDLRRKARLVAGGHLVDLVDTTVYSTTVKSISVKLLHVIAHKHNLKQLCGDVGNAYVNAYTAERVYAIAGPEFGEKEGSVVIVRKALYGLKSSSSQWHAHFGDTLRGLGFEPTRFDNDVWIRQADDETHYEYVCTHVDDFMIVGRKPQIVMDKLKEVYIIKAEGPPDYYLGNDYKQHKGRWAVGCNKYLTESLKRVESMFGNLVKTAIPLKSDDHPELDQSEILGDDGHRKFQMLIGMLNWIVGIGRFDVAHATASLSRFSACPRKGHLERALRVFGYLKKRRSSRYVVDSRDPTYHGGEEARAVDFGEIFKRQYPNAREEIDRNVPPPLVDEMAITVFVDSDHAHDKMTRRSMTGMIIFVGRTPVYYSSKRQTSIETSTYGAEFCAMRQATEETIAVRYMLRCLGVRVETPTIVAGDNEGVLLNATNLESQLKKKHVAISFHKVRESAAAGIIQPVKIGTHDNIADMFTKPLGEKPFRKLVNMVAYG